MKRKQVLKRLHRAAKDAGLSFEIVEPTNHTGVIVCGNAVDLGAAFGGR